MSLCTADALVREMPEARALRGTPSPILAVLIRLFRMVTVILREIFDESAYERFLAQHQLRSSAAAYERFCREREKIKTGPTRCC